MSSQPPRVRIFEDDTEACRAVAWRLSELIRARAAEGKLAVLGLTTGHTPVNLYRELIRMHREEGLDFSGVATFNLDEYWPIDPEALQSYNAWMRQNFLRFVNVRPENIHIPRGDLPEEQIEAHCRQYEEAIREAGGLDLQILTVGNSGHLGFNEPGADPHSRTRRVPVDQILRREAASDFFGEPNVPPLAITLGVGTILEAREICLLAFGEHKAPIVRRILEGEASAQMAASSLRQRPNVSFYLDEAAAADLTDMAAPWLAGPCRWDDALQTRAVVWLARKTDKPILKLTDEDYAESHLAELLRVGKGAYHINLAAFHRLMGTITGWPGGKKEPRRVLVFSPHPDDDVICMAGTMMRFVEQGHDLQVAYMVNGHLSVFDHDALRFADFVREFNQIFKLAPSETAAVEERIDRFLRQKRPGEADSPEAQAVKSLIRRSEAIAAAKYCGLTEEHIHFLDLPFYNTGLVEKNPLGERDIAICRELLERVRPQMVFAAGDLSDPHGTHRICLEAALSALEQYAAAGSPRPELWLYRGAWQEWPLEQIDMAVPLSPDELKRKRFAIFRHESQKDRAMFPGPYDAREFWQRAEERNIATAETYDALGLPEYHALEAFAHWPLKRPAHAQAQLVKSDER